jgi:hypothetical protein
LTQSAVPAEVYLTDHDRAAGTRASNRLAIAMQAA